MLFIDEKKVRRNFAQILRILSKKKKKEKKDWECRFRTFQFSCIENHAELSSGFVQYFIIRSYSYERKPSFLESREISKTILPLYFSSLALDGVRFFRHSAKENSSFDKIELKVSRVKGEPFTKSGTTETLVGPRRGSQCLSHQPSTTIGYWILVVSVPIKKLPFQRPEGTIKRNIAGLVVSLIYFLLKRIIKQLCKVIS